MKSFKEYFIESIEEGFDHNSDSSLHAAIMRHRSALNKAQRDHKHNDSNYHKDMIDRAEAEKRRRDIQDFEEKRAKAKR